jgi:hypothetical protein
MVGVVVSVVAGIRTPEACATELATLRLGPG